MESVIVFSLRIALLVLLWLLILLALWIQRKDAKVASQSSGAPVAAPAIPGAVNVGKPTKRGGTPRQIVIVEGPLMGSRLDLGSLDEITLGRAKECTFVVGDDYASARHARLIKRGNEWFAEDLDSRNGTFVGGYRIDQPEKISTGSDIKIGRTTVRLVA
ncbi:FHA domain-containing protein [Corynebacterium ulcerans]|uniref:FHA domain-containing protein n=1 Tax=Corynebacterium ulcerans FRC58 TaxID=1408268 RepID=A0ABM5TXY2_CORUL|nr:FHA domain-containing protein [Corynebacterium ulcerans]AIU29427.1 FHA domain-containing protein [Corynebacterium ulcerans]AIU90660.1 FHA domain-containing protein [Corynebacterium ulcerans]AKN75904.1 FHA domain-containing protein [Corynebacterium ulcerans FRC58]MBH5295365.1 FHA domain-containing protein [Corynebacterium ulcerans]MBH5302920.1 FHA domain-containing protein [Corynebacterium ulcerans]